MGFEFIVIAPFLPSQCSFSFVFRCGASFLVSSSVFLSMFVQQLVVIPVLSREGVSARPSTVPSWTSLLLDLLLWCIASGVVSKGSLPPKELTTNLFTVFPTNRFTTNISVVCGLVHSSRCPLQPAFGWGTVWLPPAQPSGYVYWLPGLLQPAVWTLAYPLDLFSSSFWSSYYFYLSLAFKNMLSVVVYLDFSVAAFLDILYGEKWLWMFTPQYCHQLSEMLFSNITVKQLGFMKT